MRHTTTASRVERDLSSIETQPLWMASGKSRSSTTTVETPPPGPHVYLVPPSAIVVYRRKKRLAGQSSSDRRRRFGKRRLNRVLEGPPTENNKSKSTRNSWK